MVSEARRVILPDAPLPKVDAERTAPSKKVMFLASRISCPDAAFTKLSIQIQLLDVVVEEMPSNKIVSPR